MKIVIVGGGSAGTSVAFQLRKLNKDIEITIIEKSNYTEYSPCALPYVLSGEIKNFDEIFIFKKQDYEENNIELKLNSEFKSVDKQKKIITILENGKKESILYDKLVFAFGAKTSIPNINGLDKSDYFVLKNIEDAKLISSRIKKNSKSVIIGGGIIGVELAHSLSSKREIVSIIEINDSIMGNVLDKDMALILKDKLEEIGIEVFLNADNIKIENKKVSFSGNEINFDKLFVCTGVQTDNEILLKTNLKNNKGIIVDKFLKTNDENIYACGDCIVVVDFVLNKKTFSQLGTSAVRQAKVIAKNILNNDTHEYEPVLNNTVSSIGNLYVGSVGITMKKAKENKIDAVCSKYTSKVKSEYYTNSKNTITIKLISSSAGIIIGGQIIGNEEVVGRLNLISLAIWKKLKIEDLANLETCYNPASAPIFDPMSICAEICLKKIKFLKK